jgi:hypothetical protein
VLAVVIAHDRAGGTRGLFHGENPIKIHLATDIDRHTLSDGNGDVMSKFERLLEAGSTELPDCRCAAEMNLMAMYQGLVAILKFASFGANTVATNLGSLPGAAIRRPPSLLSSLAMLAAIRRASSLVSSLAEDGHAALYVRAAAWPSLRARFY